MDADDDYSITEGFDFYILNSLTPQIPIQKEEGCALCTVADPEFP
jgi:hypothetical protein